MGIDRRHDIRSGNAAQRTQSLFQLCLIITDIQIHSLLTCLKQIGRPLPGTLAGNHLFHIIVRHIRLVCNIIQRDRLCLVITFCQRDHLALTAGKGTGRFRSIIIANGCPVNAGMRHQVAAVEPAANAIRSRQNANGRQCTDPNHFLLIHLISLLPPRSNDSIL